MAYQTSLLCGNQSIPSPFIISTIKTITHKIALEYVHCQVPTFVFCKTSTFLPLLHHEEKLGTVKPVDMESSLCIYFSCSEVPTRAIEYECIDNLLINDLYLLSLECHYYHVHSSLLPLSTYILNILPIAATRLRVQLILHLQTKLLVVTLFAVVAVVV